MPETRQSVERKLAVSRKQLAIVEEKIAMYTEYGGPSPFTGYGVADREGATQMCILVANPDHSVQFNTGNCFDLP